MSQASCNALNAYFSSESGRIVPQIASKQVGKSLLLDKVRRLPFPDEMGVTLSTLIVERNISTVADDAGWTPVATSTGAGNETCLPTPDVQSFGQTQVQWALSRIALESPDICLEDIRTEFQLEQQLAKSVTGLTQSLTWRMEMNLFNQYMNNSGNRITCNSALPSLSAQATGTSTLFSLANGVPTTPLTQGILDASYLTLLREGAGDGSIGRLSGNGAFIYGLICSPETSRGLIRQNADIRQDINYAFMGDKMESELLRPYGVDRAYGNYAHWVCEHMPRYDLVNNYLVRRSYWSQSSATQGTKSNVSSLYTNAAYEASLIFTDKAGNFRVPGVLDRPGGKMSFSTPDYFPVTMTWKNIPHRTCNPDGTIGFFRALAAGAWEPVHPELAYTFIHLRCSPPLGQVACGS